MLAELVVGAKLYNMEVGHEPSNDRNYHMVGWSVSIMVFCLCMHGEADT